MSYTITEPTSPLFEHQKNHAASNVPATPGLSEKDGDSSGAAAAAAEDEWIRQLAAVLADAAPAHHQIISTMTLLSNSLASGQSLPPFLPLPRPYELTRQLMALSSRHGGKQHGGGLHSGGAPWPSTAAPGGSLFVARHMPSASGSGDPERDTLGHPISATSTAGSGGHRSSRRGILDARNMEQHGYAEFAVLQVCSTLVCDDLEGLVRAVSSLVGIVDFSFRLGGHGSDGDGGGMGGKGKME